LETQLVFYQTLSPKHQKRFQHRLARLLTQLAFEGREGLELTQEMRVLVTATGVKLSFGFRNYGFPNLKKVLLYPGTYHSQLGGQLHKGEYSPAYKTLALSWPDFLEGYRCDKDNLNLGLHEWSHVLHIKCHFSQDISSQIYNYGFKKLMRYLKKHEDVRQDLLKTKYFRAYAFENQMEFMAVLIECFFETPETLQEQFPELYQRVKAMLNVRLGT
jgi:Mlc titration factor MtfA (ptsG expression regulator)